MFRVTIASPIWKRGCRSTARVFGPPRSITSATCAAVSGGVAFGACGSGRPVATSSRVNRPCLMAFSVRPSQPFFVVADAQVIGGGHLLDLLPAGIDGPASPRADRAGEREDPCLPWRVPHRLVLLRGDRSQTVHAAHVMNPVHGAATRRHADHRIASHQRGELLFGHAFSAGGALRHDQIADFGGGIPDPHFGVVRTPPGRTRAGPRAGRSPSGSGSPPIYTTTGGSPRVGQG